MAGPMMDAAFLTYEGIASDPVENNLNLEQPVWILGKYYRPDEEMDQINADILSRLWFTYRRNFAAIGGTGPMSDTGWGCMLRCGQMMLGQALMSRHLGRDWNWRKDKRNTTYMMILRSFLDKKDCLYSIHQIAQMGVGEGKDIGQWFGPNTVAQVLKKLVLFDDWSDLGVHVAMDNTVVIEDIKKICKSQMSAWGCYCEHHHNTSSTSSASRSRNNRSPFSKSQDSVEHISISSHERSCSCGSDEGTPDKRRSTSSDGSSQWRPLLLFIPLRLGLSDVNPDYYPSLKVMFTLKQSLGVIGGKPNHAHYFIGFNSDRLLYLDPHTTQQTIEPERYSVIPDDSYHCVYPCFMNFTALDPSISLGFYFHTEADLDDWAQAVKEEKGTSQDVDVKNQLVIEREKRPMFEICAKRPRHWPPFEFPKRPCKDLDSAKSDFTELHFDYGDEDKKYDSSEEYEIL